jgi:hypothetical protein
MVGGPKDQVSIPLDCYPGSYHLKKPISITLGRAIANPTNHKPRSPQVMARSCIRTKRMGARFPFPIFVCIVTYVMVIAQNAKDFLAYCFSARLRRITSRKTPNKTGQIKTASCSIVGDFGIKPRRNPNGHGKTITTIHINKCLGQSL